VGAGAGVDLAGRRRATVSILIVLALVCGAAAFARAQAARPVSTDRSRGTSASPTTAGARALPGPKGAHDREGRAADTKKGPPPATAPDELFDALAILNAELALLIADEKEKGLKFGDLRERTDEIKNDKRAMVRKFFTQDIYGLKARVVILRFDCVDAELALGYGKALLAKELNQAIKGLGTFFEHAKRCNDALFEALDGLTTPPPDGLTDAVGAIGTKLKALINDEGTGDGLSFEELNKRITEIADAKTAMATQFFTQAIYGVKASAVIDAIDCIDSQLFTARGVALQAEHPGRGNPEKSLLDADIRAKLAAFFEAAERCKSKLEDEFRAASRSPSPSPKFGVNLDGSWRHNGPGSSTLFACVSTTPAQPGASYVATVTKPDSTQVTQSGTLDPSGGTQIQTPITQFGNYTEQVAVTSSGSTVTQTTTVNVTSQQRSGCAA
jgi:hypothetical protein